MLNNMSEALQHLIQDGGELYADGEYQDGGEDDLKESELAFFGKLVGLSNCDGFKEHLQKALEAFEDKVNDIKLEEDLSKTLIMMLAGELTQLPSRDLVEEYIEAVEGHGIQGLQDDTNRALLIQWYDYNMSDDVKGDDAEGDELFEEIKSLCLQHEIGKHCPSCYRLVCKQVGCQLWKEMMEERDRAIGPLGQCKGCGVSLPGTCHEDCVHAE